MTRMEEYNALLQELEVTPDRLNFTMARAKARTRRQKARKWVGAPLISLSAGCCAYVLLVNLSMPFAAACARVPFFKELAEAVCFNPSLQAAVENRWVQPIGQTDTDNGFTMTVEYLIVDQKQLNVFYTVQGCEGVDPWDHYMLRSDFLDAQGEELNASVSASSHHVNGEMCHFVTADFASTEGIMPSRIQFNCDLQIVWDASESEDRRETVASFDFDLSFDPKFTEEATVVDVNRWMELDGQQILLKDVEIYPTHMRVNLEDHPDNTAWLRDLELYVQNEKGEQFGGVRNGISATGSPDSPFTRSFRLESSFFSDSKELTLCIAGAQWLEKERQWVTLDIENGEIEYLPRDVVLESVERSGTKLVVKTVEPDEGQQRTGQMFLGWRAPDGTEGYANGWSDYSYDGNHYQDTTINDYPWDTIELELNYNLTTQYTEPVTIDLF